MIDPQFLASRDQATGAPVTTTIVQSFREFEDVLTEARHRSNNWDTRTELRLQPSFAHTFCRIALLDQLERRGCMLTMVDIAGIDMNDVPANGKQTSRLMAHDVVAVERLVNSAVTRGISDEATLATARESAITSLLEPLLCGNSRPFVAACIAPTEQELSASARTLRLLGAIQTLGSTYTRMCNIEWAQLVSGSPISLTALSLAHPPVSGIGGVGGGGVGATTTTTTTTATSGFSNHVHTHQHQHQHRPLSPRLAEDDPAATGGQRQYSGGYAGGAAIPPPSPFATSKFPHGTDAVGAAAAAAPVRQGAADFGGISQIPKPLTTNYTTIGGGFGGAGLYGGVGAPSDTLLGGGGYAPPPVPSGRARV